MGSRIEQYYSSRHASGHDKSVENKHLHALKVRQWQEWKDHGGHN